MPSDTITALKKWNRARLAKRRSLRKPYTDSFGVLAIMKNETTNIDEWIRHYIWMGASKIFLIDNGSTDDTVAKARAWQERGQVELVEYPAQHMQRQHYWRAFKHFRIARKCGWVLIADLDEFWFCPSGNTIAETLTEFENFDVVYSNWVMFGSSGLVEQPPSLREHFIHRRKGTNSHTYSKYIVRTKLVKRSSSMDVHRFHGADSARTVTDIERFQLNHYPIQSLQFFRSVKMTRGDVYKVSSDAVRDMDYFRRYDEGCTDLDRGLADLVIRHESLTNRP
jgi:Glycosyltransferase family 92